METVNPAPQEESRTPVEEFLPATIADAADVKRLLQEAADLKWSQGDNLWGTHPFTDDEVAGMINGGDMFVYKTDGIAAASVLLLKNDERMWGEEQGSDDTAVYIHKLCVGDAFRGQGVGVRTLLLSEQYAKDKGKTKLRLDCPQDSPLSVYYEKQGFREIRRYDRPGSVGRKNPDKDVYRAALYEKELS
jgi:GNAT superfamily N-acetyltransferase